jgi:hypothetical protein
MQNAILEIVCKLVPLGVQCNSTQIHPFHTAMASRKNQRTSAHGAKNMSVGIFSQYARPQ